MVPRIGLYPGISLFESLHASREDEHYQTYRVAERVSPHPLIIRTFDLGGDKLAPDTVDVRTAQSVPRLARDRVCLENTDIFKTQLRAILRASAVGNVKIMFPMISGLDELRRTMSILNECKEELRRTGSTFGDATQAGAMIEIPSAAISADILAREVDFFSIGTNDLIQYALAVDRREQSASPHLYEPTHPAVLRLLKMIADATPHANDIWVGVCGEIAGDIALIPLLLGLGMDELSASATLVPRVKRAVQSLTIAGAGGLSMKRSSSRPRQRFLISALELADQYRVAGIS
jgi:phosphotransferase system enzyme I (PtsI)